MKRSTSRQAVLGSSWLTLSAVTLLWLLCSLSATAASVPYTEIAISDNLGSSPALDSAGNLYIGGFDGNLYKINSAGEVEGSFPTAGMIGSTPAIHNNVVYFGSYDRVVYALNTDLSERWRHQADAAIYASPAIDRFGHVYIVSRGGTLYKFDNNGNVIWRLELGFDMMASPAIGMDGTIYVSDVNGELYAISSAGAINWQINLGGGLSSAALGYDGNIYVTSEWGILYAVSPTGVVSWQHTTGTKTLASPTLGPNNTIYVANYDQATISLLNYQGEVIANYAVELFDAFGNRLADSIYTTPVVSATHTLYFATKNGRVLAYDSLGRVKYDLQFDSNFVASPVIGNDGYVYLASTDGRIVKLDAKEALSVDQWPAFGLTDTRSRALLDSDGDKLPDRWEVSVGLDPFTFDNDTDLDGDGLTLSEELLTGTDPHSIDTDGDGIDDGTDALPFDLDNDGLSFIQENELGTSDTTDDTDNDGFTDRDEALAGLDPTDPTDANQDTDGDLFSDLVEFFNGTDPTVNEFVDVFPEFVDSIANEGQDSEGNIVAGLGGADSIVMSADTRFMYIGTADSVLVFERDTVSGTLVFVERLLLHTGSVAANIPDYRFRLSISPDGRFVYAVYGQSALDGLHAFDRNQFSGTLTEFQHIPASTLRSYGVRNSSQYYFSKSYDLSAELSGRLLLATDAGLVIFSVDQDSGLLFHERTETTFRPKRIEFSPDKQRAFDVISNNNRSVFDVDPVNATFTLNRSDYVRDNQWLLPLSSGRALQVYKPGFFSSAQALAVSDTNPAAIQATPAVPVSVGLASRADYYPRYSMIHVVGTLGYSEMHVTANGSLLLHDTLSSSDFPSLANAKSVIATGDGKHVYVISSADHTSGQIAHIRPGRASIPEPDSDGDGVGDLTDAFPEDPTEQFDTDNDGIGNNTDDDDDGDGVADIADAFPLDPTETLDTDNDGIGNNTDDDDDGDSVLDVVDAFPLDPAETTDTDGDGIGNNADDDDDGDSVADAADAFPLDATETLDTDGDGIGNNADNDDDGDSVADTDDAFPLDATETLDTDGDGIGNNTDTDDDGDQLPDVWELAFGLDSLLAADALADADGDSLSNLEEFLKDADPTLADTDGDGVDDATDDLPRNELEVSDLDQDGIGDNADTDDDGDGKSDDWELANGFDPTFAEDPALDTDNDGLSDVGEFLAATNPRSQDSDSDGMFDGYEVRFGLDPLIDDASFDFDEDGYDNLVEFGYGTDPFENEYDDRAVTIIQKIENGELDAAGNSLTGFDGSISVQVSPDGKYVYVANFGGLFVFQRNLETGLLSHLQTLDINYSAFKGSDLAISENGEFLFALEGFDLVVLTVDSFGLLSESSRFPMKNWLYNFVENSYPELRFNEPFTDGDFTEIHYSKANKRLYVLSSPGVLEFNVDEANGSVSFVGLTTTDTGQILENLTGFAISDDDNLAWVATEAESYLLTRNSLDSSWDISQLLPAVDRVIYADDLNTFMTITGSSNQFYSVLGSTVSLDNELANANMFADVAGYNSRADTFVGLASNSYIEVDTGTQTVIARFTPSGGFGSIPGWQNFTHLSDLALSPDGKHAYIVNFRTGPDGIYVLGTGRKGIGHPDSDNDGVRDLDDVFPDDPSEQFDTDGDGIGNNADADDDGDGFDDAIDAFPLISTEWLDTDADGIGNNADTDDDADGVEDTADAFPLDPLESLDTDGDGIGNVADTDDDGDGVEDSSDAFPLDADETVDSDGDGVGNVADNDDDNDSVPDVADAFPLDPTESADSDADGIGNNADPDDDNDLIPDFWEDIYGLNPLDPTDADQNADSDSLTNLEEFEKGSNPTLADSDGDGVNDDLDDLPQNEFETGDNDGDLIGDNTDVDDDNDGKPDLWELDNGFDPLVAEPGDLDTDGDMLTDLEEFLFGTDPRNVDTDGDTIPDSYEVAFGLDATDSSDATEDFDGDGYNNLLEYQLGTDPFDNEFDDRAIAFIEALNNGDVDQAGNSIVGLNNPLQVEVSGDGSKVYVRVSTGILVFSRDAETGVLTFLEESSYPTNSYTFNRLFISSPNGRFVYSVERIGATLGSSVTVLRVLEQADDSGLLVERHQYEVVNIEMVDFGFGPFEQKTSKFTALHALDMSDDGEYLYLGTDKGLFSLSVNSETGTVTELDVFGSELPTLDVRHLALSANGSKLLMTTVANERYLFDRDSDSGLLSLRHSDVLDGTNISHLASSWEPEAFFFAQAGYFGQLFRELRFNGSEFQPSSNNIFTVYPTVNVTAEIIVTASQYGLIEYTYSEGVFVQFDSTSTTDQGDDGPLFVPEAGLLSGITASGDGKHLYVISEALDRVVVMRAGRKGIGHPDTDGDGYDDREDAFPNDPSEQFDTDADGVGDNADVFPNDPTEQFDFDGDAIGDNADTDDDNDGFDDTVDLFPRDASEWADNDLDGLGDNIDLDDDNDDLPDQWEVDNGLNPFDATDRNGDLDGDTLDNFTEFELGTKANNTDSDGDLISDLWEVTFGLDPTDETDGELDIDGDGFSNYQEFLVNTDPNDPAVYPGAPGLVQWDALTQDRVRSSATIDAMGNSYIGSDDSFLYKYDVEGREVWKFETGGPVRTKPALGMAGEIVFGSSDGKVYAVSSEGVELWSVTTMGPVESSPAIGQDGTVFIGSDDGKVYALFPEDGFEKWSFDTGAPVKSSPTIAPDGIIYIGSDNNKVYTIHSDTGGPLEEPATIQ